MLKYVYISDIVLSTVSIISNIYLIQSCYNILPYLIIYYLPYLLQEDPWNAILSGAATGGILAARAGLKAAGKSALAGGVILAAIEGLNLLVVSNIYIVYV